MFRAVNSAFLVLVAEEADVLREVVELPGSGSMSGQISLS